MKAENKWLAFVFALAILTGSLAFAKCARANEYDTSQGEGNYNGSNSQGAAGYYYGGGREVYGGYGDDRPPPPPPGKTCFDYYGHSC